MVSLCYAAVLRIDPILMGKPETLVLIVFGLLKGRSPKNQRYNYIEASRVGITVRRLATSTYC